MYPFPIGVMLDSFRTDVNTALDKAQALGAQGVQIRATFDDLTPAALTAERRQGAFESCQGPRPGGLRPVRRPGPWL